MKASEVKAAFSDLKIMVDTEATDDEFKAAFDKLDKVINAEPQKFVRVTVEEYKQLVDKSVWLGCLEAAGVDNWEGYGYARELLADDADE